jgi:hypothetical protein
MTERYSEFPKFDRRAFEDALGADSRSLRDVAHGEGAAVTLDNATELEVYPTAGVARVTTENARVELFRVPGVMTDDEAGRVLFQHGEADNRARLLVRADGTVSFYPVVRAAGSAPAAETARPTPVDQTPAQPRPDGTTAPAREEEPTITLTGRLGRDPWFMRRDDEVIAGFPLAVNHDHGSTTWHTVKARGEAAEQVHAGQEAGYVRRGKQVHVTGSFAEQVGKGKPDFEATDVIKPDTKPRRPDRQQR